MDKAQTSDLKTYVAKRKVKDLVSMEKAEQDDVRDSYEGDEWQSVSNLENEVRRYQECALTWLEANRQNQCA